ncbi:hypothetical protein [Salininema proteolyticum]|uniref:DUF4351 domain-containing protein n=1 Tax=Salininema proteolyticum TaxID=1607685 RepID=A0ABV8U0F7_9ACTN
MAMETFQFVDKFRQEGVSIGRLREIRKSIPKFAELRGIELSTGDLRRIQACEDYDQLEAWQNAAMHARHRADIFGN